MAKAIWEPARLSPNCRARVVVQGSVGGLALGDRGLGLADRDAGLAAGDGHEADRARVERGELRAEQQVDRVVGAAVGDDLRALGELAGYQTDLGGVRGGPLDRQRWDLLVVRLVRDLADQEAAPLEQVGGRLRGAVLRTRV